MSNRTHCISVRVSADELARLDAECGRRQRGAYLRDCWHGRPPPHLVPAINQTAWLALSRSAANLNQLAYACNRSEFPEVGAIRLELARFRAALLGGGE